MKPKVVCLVGHENWGKSETLYYLVGESHHRAWFKINDVDVFVRHMSNDDLPDSFIDFIIALDPDYKPCVVIALCPNFINTEAKTVHILNTLRKKGYALYFWVLHKQYGSSKVVNIKDVRRLQKYGEVKVYKEKEEAPARAKAFNTYLLKILRGGSKR